MFACLWPTPVDEPSTVRPEDTIQELRTHIERQEKRERYLELKVAAMTEEAKQKLAAGDKKGAINLMKKKKLYENELVKIANVKMTLETQCIQLESASTTAQAFSAMSAGNDTMKRIHQNVGIDKVDDVMMDIQDEMQTAEEINTAIGQSIDPLMGAMDEDDLMKELEELDCNDLEQQMDQAETAGKTGNKFKFPSVPNKSMNKKEEEEIRKLQAELAM